MSGFPIGRLSDERGLITRHIITVLIMVGVLVFLVAQLGPLAWERVYTANEAEDIASAITSNARMKGTIDEGLAAGWDRARAKGYSEEEFEDIEFILLPEDEPLKTGVRVAITKRVNTWLVRVIKPISKHAEFTVSSEANFTTPMYY